MTDLIWAAFAALLVAGGCFRIAWGKRAERSRLHAALDAIIAGKDVLWNATQKTVDGVMTETFHGEVEGEPYEHVVVMRIDRVRTHAFSIWGEDHRCTNKKATPLSEKFGKAYLKHLDRQLEQPV